MAPVKPIRTYGRANSSVNAKDAFDILFAKNLIQRKLNKVSKRRKVKIKELPSRVVNFVNNDSLDVSTEDTFDKLLKKDKHKNEENTVTQINNTSNNVSSKERSLSKSVIKSVTYSHHTPVLTRRRYRKLSVENRQDSELPSVSRFKDPTNESDRVLDSLLVDSTSKQYEKTSLSYLKVPCTKEITSTSKVFTDSIREQIMVHSSTPLIPKVKGIIVQPVSPIEANLTNLINKSFEEIKEWDHSFPDVTDSIDQLEGFGGFTENEKSIAIDSVVKSINILRQPNNFVTLRTRPGKQLERQDFISSKSHSNLKEFGFGTSQLISSGLDSCNSYSLNDFEKFEGSCKDILISPDNTDIIDVTHEHQIMKPTLHSANRLDFITQRKHIFNRRKVEPRNVDRFTDGIKHCVVLLNRISTGHVQINQDKKNHIIDEENNIKIPKEISMKQLIVRLCRMDALPKSSNCEVDKNYTVNNFLLSKKNKTENLGTTNMHDVIDSTKRDEAKQTHIAPQLVVNLTSQKILTPLKRYSNKDSINRKQFRNVIKKVSFENEPHLYVHADPQIESEEHENVKNDFASDSTQDSSTSSDIVENTLECSMDDLKEPMALSSMKYVQLKGGKSWRRSLFLYRKSNVFENIPEEELPTEALDNKIRASLRRQSIRYMPVPLRHSKITRGSSLLANFALTSVSETDSNVLTSPSIKDSQNILETVTEKSLQHITARELVLQRCGQTEPLLFEDCYPASSLKNCHKIGEGVYGEVFLYKKANTTAVMKIIPIEGEELINGERQKKFDEILSEIIITMELSNLRNYGRRKSITVNRTSAFPEVQRVCCVKGRYPERLIELWELYDESKGSENDSPEIFKDDQLYIVLELGNAGQDLEAFVFTNASQAHSMIKQVACALAVAENKLKFEHRDLHWGNILLKSVDRNKQIDAYVSGSKVDIPTKGIEATIIDFTLSRIEHDGVVIFNDLGQDPELFEAQGDYQFEIYRLMKNHNGNEWQHYEPYTNILWLDYILDKAINGGLRYKNTKTQVHEKYLNELRCLRRDVFKHKSVKDFVQYHEF